MATNIVYRNPHPFCSWAIAIKWDQLTDKSKINYSIPFDFANRGWNMFLLILLKNEDANRKSVINKCDMRDEGFAGFVEMNCRYIFDFE